MADETPAAPSPPPAPAPPKPLEPGDFVTHVGGHPQRGDRPDEPVGRVVAAIPQVKVLTDKDGKALIDADGAVRTRDDGVKLAVSWPSIRLECKHRPEDLARWEPRKS